MHKRINYEKEILSLTHAELVKLFLIFFNLRNETDQR